MWLQNCYDLESQTDDETEDSPYETASCDLLTQHNQSRTYSLQHPTSQFQPFVPQLEPALQPAQSPFIQKPYSEQPQSQPESLRSATTSTPQPLPTHVPPSESEQTPFTASTALTISNGDDDDEDVNVSSTDDSSEDNQEHDSVMICLFKTVKHSKSKHRCDLINCVIRYKHREYFFNKCTGEFQSA